MLMNFVCVYYFYWLSLALCIEYKNLYLDILNDVGTANVYIKIKLTLGVHCSMVYDS